MKTFVIGLLAIISASTCAFAASPAATQDWVRHYVSTNTSGGGVSEPWVRSYVATNQLGKTYSYQLNAENGMMTSTITNEDGRVFIISHEMHDQIALVSSNCTQAAISMGVTNGTIFAYRGYGVFTNAQLDVSINSVGTNYLNFCGVNSHTNELGVDTFDGYFDIRGYKITRSLTDELVATNSIVGDVVDVWKPSAFDRLVAFISNIIFPSAYAGTWSAEGFVYTPTMTEKNGFGNFSYFIADKDSGKSSAVYCNEDGSLNEKSLIKAMSERKVAPNSILIDLVTQLVPKINEIEDGLIQLDKAMEDLSKKLKTEFDKLVEKLNTLEKKLNEPTDNGGTSETEVEQKTKFTEEKITIITREVKPLKVDGKTIGVKNEKTENACYQLKNFPGAWGTNVGLYPVIGNQSGHVGELMWIDPWSYFDGDSLKVDRSDSFTHLPSKQDDKHGFHIAGWYTPTAAPYHCAETIASNLGSDDEDMHYVLTKKFAGSEAGSMHYMKIGKIGGGSAFKFIGTDNHGEVVGYGSRTNNVTFASKAGSNIEVSVSKSGDDVTISIGAYWVQ